MAQSRSNRWKGEGTVVICHPPDRAVLSRDAAE
jgi:hypothetical protein